MLKKLFMIMIKLIPIITLYKGVTSGSGKMLPILNSGKVAITQYEISKLTKLVGDDYVENNGSLIHPDDFSKFIEERYHNSYSEWARKLLGGKDTSLTKDIWGSPFVLYLNDKTSKVSVISYGVDKQFKTKDDLGLGFAIAATTSSSGGGQETQVDTEVYDEYGFDNNGLDRDGFDRDGFDRDGFDREGFDKDGFDRDGFDREGYNRDGVDWDGNPRRNL